jgi:isoleucyl-tRNA synthetase
MAKCFESTLEREVDNVDRSSKWAEFFLRPRPFLPGSFVTTDSGTGLVHMAPDHGEDDFELCKANGLEPVFAVEGDGKYRVDWAWLCGQGSVINPKFNAPDGPICSDLRAAGGLLAASADYKHSYPHSWRSKAKVIYRCTPQWFVPMDRPVDMPHAESRAETRWDNEGGALEHPNATLRQIAVNAIAETCFVPEKGRNRIGAMVEGRPDWVLSRQRAWGVPITLFVKMGTNQYLADPAVNARIVAAIRADGVDAWTDARAQEYLGAEYKTEDYERVTDILDVWFDSGCTHAFVLESGKWPDLLRPEGWTGPKADLYLEGSDQHRGWFQSSLLESCATRGHAPYKAVLTHGFTMDAKGMKMSKSLGNTINPLDLMRDNGADILRLWALSVDFTEDHRIGKEILAGVADQYRKLRNTFRYLLGALDGYDESERVADVAAMPELERYMLALLAKLDGTLSQVVADFDFNTYVRALTDFCNEDLSAFFFDIRKDCLYCDAVDDPKRRAYRTVLDTLFHALVRYAAPVLVFTAEEVWGTRFPEAGSVHLLVWPQVESSWSDNDAANAKWDRLRVLRGSVTRAIEPLRRDKTIGSSLEAEVDIAMATGEDLAAVESVDFAELSISARVTGSMGISYPGSWFDSEISSGRVTKTAHHKCGRCWRHLPEVTEDGDLCSRCNQVVSGMDAAA